MKKALTIISAPLLLLFLGCSSHRTGYVTSDGFGQGSTYHIVYKIEGDSAQATREKVESLIPVWFEQINKSVSGYDSCSAISRINRNEHVEPDEMFLDVFNLAQDIAQKTDGAFDITVAPLVNAWGFGFKKGKMPVQSQIDSLLSITGYQKVKYIKTDGKGDIIKKDNRIMLDCSAIAKGYGSDMVARYLESQGVKNYMVEIGGEVVTRGINSQQQPWRIGISKPVDDTLNVNRDIQAVLKVKDMAMATSGNYRNFYYKNGKKYAHTIDPKTGRPVQHSLLSATVLAKDCATADAYATAFMVMGVEKAKLVLKNNTEIMAYFIYSDDSGKTKVWYSDTIRQKLARALKLQPAEIKSYEKTITDISVKPETVDDIKEMILEGETDLYCPICGSKLVVRIAKMYDLEDNLVLHPKAHCSQCTFQIK